MGKFLDNNLNFLRGANEKDEDSKAIQSNYLGKIEDFFKAFIGRRKLPESGAGLEMINEAGKAPAFIDRIHKPPERMTQKINRPEKGPKTYLKYNSAQPGYQRLWLLIDFDDTLNKTTLYQENLKKRLCALTEMQPETFSRLYDEAKQVNQEGKKVLNFYSFINSIKKVFPDHDQEIDSIVEEEGGADKYLDQSVRRSLLAIRASGAPIRISILTFGDLAYQQSRINKTDLREVVDDIIYTEGGKGETLERLLDIDYKSGTKRPFIVTVDDNPEQIEDLDKMSLKNDFVNVHYKNPEAKRFNDTPRAKNIPVLGDKPNEAGVNLYKLMRVCLRDEMQLTKQNIYKILDNKNFETIYNELNNDDTDVYGFGDFFKNEASVIYENRPNGDMVRKSDYMRYGKIEHDEEVIGKNGELFEIKPFGLSHSPISREEYIRGGE